jgi:hypothetical protein
MAVTTALDHHINRRSHHCELLSVSDGGALQRDITIPFGAGTHSVDL